VGMHLIVKDLRLMTALPSSSLSFTMSPFTKENLLDRVVGPHGVLGGAVSMRLLLR